MPTSGEQLLFRLLSDLPKTEYFFRYEPRLVQPDGHSSKPDFVVVAASLGVMIVEVKDWTHLTGGDHDRIHIITREGKPQTLPNPLKQVEQYAYDLNRRFETRAELWEERRGKNYLKFPWQPVIVLPYIAKAVIHQFEQKAIWPRNLVLGKEDLQNVSRLRSALARLPWRYRLDRPIRPDLLDIVREILDPSLAVIDQQGQIVGTVTRLQDHLIKEGIASQQPQQMMLPDMDFSQESAGISENNIVRLVRGVAGSGKTLVLVRRVQHVRQQYPESKVAVLTFNRDLADDLAQRIGRPDDDHLHVSTFHKLCRILVGDPWRSPHTPREWFARHVGDDLKALNVTAEFVEDELSWRREKHLLNDDAYFNAVRLGRGQAMRSAQREKLAEMHRKYIDYKVSHPTWVDWEDVAQKAMLALDHHMLEHSFDAVLIDEAQDFAPSWMHLAKRLLKPNGSLFICDDPSQSIFRSYSWQEKGVSVVGRTRVLRVPFRSTREISLAAHTLIEADEMLRTAEERAEPDLTSYELASGPKPRLLTFDATEDEIIYVTKHIQQQIAQGIPPMQIAVLCHSFALARAWEKYTKNYGIYVKHFEKMKGLEFQSVFLPGLESAFHDVMDTDEIAVGRRKFFTAMTRARYYLMLTAVISLPPALAPLFDAVDIESPEEV